MSFILTAACNLLVLSGAVATNNVIRNLGPKSLVPAPVALPDQTPPELVDANGVTVEGNDLLFQASFLTIHIPICGDYESRKQMVVLCCINPQKRNSILVDTEIRGSSVIKTHQRKPNINSDPPGVHLKLLG